MKFDRISAYDGLAKGFVLAGHFNEADTYMSRRPHGMSDWLITYTLGGEGYFTTPGVTHTSRTGDITILKPGTPHEYGTVQGKRWHFVWAHFAQQTLEPYLLPEQSCYQQPIENASARKRIYRCFKRILIDSRERNEYWLSIFGGNHKFNLLTKQCAFWQEQCKI